MFINVARHDQRGTANSSILTGWDLGFGIGCLLGGVVAEHFGYSGAFWMVAIENAAAVVLFFVASWAFFEKEDETISKGIKSISFPRLKFSFHQGLNFYP